MKKLLVFTAIYSTLAVGSSVAQEKCGMAIATERLLANDPSLVQVLDQYRKDSKMEAEAYAASMANSAQKTTASVIVPIVFHILLNQNQLDSIGGVQGVRDRVTSQLNVINNDFNKRNSDTSTVPTVFKSKIGNPGISFGLAHTKPDGTSTDGYEIKVLPATTTGFDESSTYIKSTFAGGVDAWDNTKYLNVWIVNLETPTLLGFAYSPYYAKNVVKDARQTGVVIDFGAFGVRPAGSPDYWYPNVYKGRTLTHELGHFFNLWHIWGNTPVGSGVCTDDDDVNDTPQQMDASNACYDVAGNDCTGSASGTMFVNYMDYSGDGCTRMFTKNQAERMQVEVSTGGMSYELTKHPELLLFPTTVASVEKENPFNIYPNPSTGIFNVSFTKRVNDLQAITVFNTVGQSVQQINILDNTNTTFNINLSDYSKGIYILQFQFTEGTVTRKVMIQ